MKFFLALSQAWTSDHKMTNLAKNFNSFKQAEEDTQPGHSKADQQLPPDCARILYSRRKFQNMTSVDKQSYFVKAEK